MTTSVTANDSDPEGSALTPQIASQPLHGTVTFNPDG
ncbi:Ig-like domain-containing protein, partial [Bosea sp. (in: a-proteobacteria)]